MASQTDQNLHSHMSQQKKNAADESMSYSAIMALKGSKCTCLHRITGKGAEGESGRRTICGTFCKRLTANQ